MMTLQDSNGTRTWEYAVFATCGAFSVAACLLAFFLIYRHLKHFTEPKPQTNICRILLMVPIYAIDSWLSIYFRHYSVYFDIVRDAYEAYVLYQFFDLLVYYFETECRRYYGADFEGITAGEILANFPPTKHPWPFGCLCPRIIPGPHYFLKSKRYILQYVIVKPAASLIAIILHSQDLYKPGNFSPKYGYLYIAITINISVSLALYYLLLFYMLIVDVIQEYKPLYKLLAIKAILFFAFWQSVAIGLLSFIGVLPPIDPWTEDEVAEGINNIVICIEMFILSVAHIWIFPYDEYRAGRGTHTLLNTWQNVITRVTTDVLNQADLVGEAKVIFSSDTKAQLKERDKQLTERTRLLEKERKERKHRKQEHQPDVELDE